MVLYRSGFHKREWVLIAGLVFGFALVVIPNIAQAACATGDGVWIYSGQNCTRDAFPLLTDPGLISSLSTLGAWNDRADSVQLVGSHTVFFYEDAGFSGKSFCMKDPATVNLIVPLFIDGTNDWRDDIGSIEVDPGKTCDKPLTTLSAEETGGCSFLNPSCWVKKSINVLTNVITGILDLLIAPIALAVKLVAGAVAKLMGAAIAYLSAITVSPGISTTPEFVTNGWNFTRNLANNFFILILAFIGLATILRLQAYQLQKTLPLLIIMALLVNFSGVVVGFFADIGTLVTNFFIQATAKTAWDNIGATFTKMSFWSGDPAASFATHIVEIFFYMLVTIIYFVIMLLFALRVVILWTLTITAPLAFVLYILPATKRFFSDWWKQLIQWSLIGIPISFFLFLASKVLGGGAEPALQLSGAAPSAIANLAAPFTTFVLLFTGITISMAMAPATAQGAINLGKKWGLQGAMGFGSAVSRRVPLGKFGENMRKRGQGIEVAQADKTRLERWGGAVLGKIPGMDRLGSAINVPVLQKRKDETQARIDELEAKGRRKTKAERDELQQKKTELQNIDTQISTASAGWATQGLARFARRGATVFGTGMELAGKEVDMRTGAKDEREYQQGVKDVGSKDSFHVFNMVNEELAKGPLANQNRIVGMLNGVRNRGDGDDIEDALKSGQLNSKVIGETIKTGRRMGPPGFRPLLKSFLGDIMVNPQEFGFDATRDKATGKWEGKDARLLVDQLGIERIPSKFNAQDFQGDTLAPKNFNMDTEQGRLFMQLMIKERGADFMGQIARRPRKAESIAAMQYIFREGKFAKTGLGEDWLLENDAEDVLRYLDSPGARSLGLGRNRTREEIQDIIEQKKAGKTKEDLSEQQAQLEKERDDLQLVQDRTPRERRRLKSINTTIQQIEITLNRMDEEQTPTQGLLDNVERLKTEIAQAAQAIEQGETNIQVYRSRATAERALRPLQQELNRRGIPIQTVQADIVPEPPAPLPEIQPAMPDPLKRLINQGNTEIQTIVKKTKELQDNLADIREFREDLTEVTQTMTRLNEELRQLNTQGQAGTLAPQLQARLPELQGEIRRLQGRETAVSQQINEYQGLTARAEEEILTSKQKVDGPDGIRERIVAQIQPLQRKYERTQRSQRREQRLRQRQERRRTR